MGTADAIVDLVSSGTTLRENNLKEVEGGTVLQSQVTIYNYSGCDDFF
jgi:ATP phosphoribosyltransferase